MDSCNGCVRRPEYQYGFWWYYDPKRDGWFTGSAPQIQVPDLGAYQESSGY